VLSWQSEEGWFWEYEGCDPGYHTLTVWCLARLYQLEPSPKLKEALTKAVRLADAFVHPDGSYGGEYGSRNTYNFFPHGFELVGSWLPEALSINDYFLKGLGDGLAPCYADDHIIGHHAWNYLLAWRDFVPDRPPARRSAESVWLKQAGIVIDRRANTELYLALNKGGVFKLFRDARLIASDTQLSLAVQTGGKTANAVGHLIDDYEIKVGENEISVRGSLGWAKHNQMTPLKLVVLRLVMITIGRFFPNLIRRVLQKMLITGKKNAPFQFARSLRWENGAWRITDELRARSWDGVAAAGIGCDQTSIHVVMSRTYQRAQLQGWLDLTDQVRELRPGEALRIERVL
jgi:hypothetical protein